MPTFATPIYSERLAGQRGMVLETSLSPTPDEIAQRGRLRGLGEELMRMDAENQPHGEEFLEMLINKAPAAEWMEWLFTSLLVAARADNVDVFHRLFALCESNQEFWAVERRIEHLLNYTVSGGSSEVLSALLEVECFLSEAQKVSCVNRFSALFCAANNGHRGCVKVLIQAGVPLECKGTGDTALTVAVENGHEDVVLELLAAGVKTINDEGLKMRPKFRSSPLCIATSKNNETMMNILLSAGADFGKSGTDTLPVIIAAKAGYCAPLKLLLSAGADANVVNSSGKSALHMACLYSREGAVELLLRHSASLTSRCSEGLSPSDVVAMEALSIRENPFGVRHPSTLNVAETATADRIYGMMQRASAWRRRGWLVMMRARRLVAVQLLDDSPLEEPPPAEHAGPGHDTIERKQNCICMAVQGLSMADDPPTGTPEKLADRAKHAVSTTGLLSGGGHDNGKQTGHGGGWESAVCWAAEYLSFDLSSAGVSAFSLFRVVHVLWIVPRRCTAMLGVPGGVQTRESLRRVLKIWSEGGNMHECAQNPQQRPQGTSRRRSNQRPALPMEARARSRVGGKSASGAVAEGQSGNGERSVLLAVQGSQVDSSVNRDRQLALAEAAAARWEKRYKQQVSATEKALLEKRNAKISLRETERVLEEERAEAARAAHAASVEAAEAAEALRDIADAQDEREGGLKNALSESAEHSLQSMVVRERCERQLRQRLQTSEAKLAAATTEMDEMRKALEAAEKHRSLQPVVANLGEILKECLSSFGLVRGMPEGEFHALVSTLRDRAEKAARGFVSVEGLHAAAEGARALDSMRDVRKQLAEALLDASRQRARRVAADARLKEKEAGEMERAFGKEDLLKARKEVDETRARMAVADAEMKQLKQCLREEQERSAAAWRAATHNRSAPIADLRVIFDEGQRLVEAKLKLKAQQIQQEVSKMQQDLSAEARLQELGAGGRVSPRPVTPARKELLQFKKRHN
eukprot:g12616.t1